MFVIYNPSYPRKPWRDTKCWHSDLNSIRPYTNLRSAKYRAKDWANARVLTVEEVECIDLLRKM